MFHVVSARSRCSTPFPGIMRIHGCRIINLKVFVFSSADDYTTGYMPSNAMIDSNGMVFWSPPARLRSSCKFKIRADTFVLHMSICIIPRYRIAYFVSYFRFPMTFVSATTFLRPSIFLVNHQRIGVIVHWACARVSEAIMATSNLPNVHNLTL